MENASQALIIAGGILIAIIVLSVGVYLFVNYSKVSETYGQVQENVEINKFNANFTKFEGRTNITAQEIITLNNFVINYKEKNGIEAKVICNEMERYESDTKFIQENSVNEDGNIIYFKCKKESIKYGKDGRITEIEFQKVN